MSDAIRPRDRSIIGFILSTASLSFVAGLVANVVFGIRLTRAAYLGCWTLAAVVVLLTLRPRRK